MMDLNDRIIIWFILGMLAMGVVLSLQDEPEPVDINCTIGSDPVIVLDIRPCPVATLEVIE